MAVKCILTGQTPSVLDGVTENVQTQIDAKAADNAVVHLAGNETISGTKTFAGGVVMKGGADVASSGNAILNVEGVATDTDYIDMYVSGGANDKRPLVLQNNNSGSGNVGIGTATPSEKLEVVGNVKATKFKGDGSELTNVPYPVTSVAGKTGAVTLAASDVGAQPKITVTGILQGDGNGNITAVESIGAEVVTLNKSDVGLGNVDNTSDANKPISNATQAALNDKQSKITANGLLTGDGSGGVTAAVKGTDYDTEIGIVHYEDSFDSVEAAYNKSKRLFCSENPAGSVGTDSDKLYALLNRSQPYFSDGKVEITYTFTCLDKTITLTRTKRNSTATPVDTWAKGSQAFNPRLHASTHKTGGGDAIAPSEIGAQPSIIANGILKGDGTGTVTAAEETEVQLVELTADSIGAASKEYVDSVATGTTLSITLPSAGWSGTTAPYTMTLTNAAITATSTQELSPATDITADQLTALQNANIIDGGQAAGSMTLKAFGEKPSVDIPVRIIVKG